MMKGHTVSQLARAAGVSVRTLHHYDKIGLLHPAARTASGYRVYGRAELLRLQQIIYFKKLYFPLGRIRTILDDPAFDKVQALERHRDLLGKQIAHLKRMQATIDRTIQDERDKAMTLTDDELYEGLSNEQIERYKREAREMYDPAVVAESERRVSGMTKEQWRELQAEGDAVTRGLAALTDRAPSDPEVQALIARHYAWIETFWTPTAETYRGLGRGYASHPEFRAFYDRHKTDMADFLSAAMAYFADTTLSQSAGE
jgi:DNA-binding transcriptional MerR regulator